MKARLKEQVIGLARAWDRFWFGADGRAQIGAFTKGFGILLFVCYLIRGLDLELYYGERGIMPLSILSDVAPMDFRWSIFRVFPSDTALWIGHFAFLASLLGMALLKRPRVAIWVAWFLHLSFVHRNLGINYGADLIACFYFLFLSFADYRGDGAFRPGDLRAILGSMAFRLCQLQICIIYGYSGLKKLKGYTWWNGEAIWGSLAQWQIARWDFSWMAHFPLALAGAAFLTLAWEIYFPALIWNHKLRGPMLAVGLLLHLGIAVTLSLPFFAMLMVLTYLFFLDRTTIVRASERARRIFATQRA